MCGRSLGWCGRSLGWCVGGASVDGLGASHSSWQVDAAHADVFPRSAQTLAVRAGMQDNLTSEMWGAADLLELRSTADTHYCYIPMLRPMGYSMLQHMVCCTDACCGSGHAAWRSLLAGEASVCWVAGRHSELL